MPVPDQLPPAANEPSEIIRRDRALESIRSNLAVATARLQQFLPDKTPQEITRRMHTARTEIMNDSDNPEIVTYYSLWTDAGDMRLTEAGQLLRSESYPGKYNDLRTLGVDKSTIVSMHDLHDDARTYKTAHLLSLANALEKFLRPAKAEE